VPARRAAGAPGERRATRDLPELRPLTARSVVLSLLLGSHPPQLPVRALVAVAAGLGVSEGSARVALSRMVADGELESAGGAYRLSPPFLARQDALDRGRTPGLRPWRGGWEVAVVRAASGAVGQAGGPGVEGRLAGLLLAPLRTGVWLRPDNLDRAWPDDTAAACDRFLARTGGDGAELAARLWDLTGWATRAEALLAGLTASGEPPHRFALAAAAARHLRDDPLLPAALLPRRWPGARLRAAYARYETELGAAIRAAAR
jgi:phenylacetic acid degradation operon negative regulatory protein